MAQYKVLNRAQLSYDYLHTNSTTHEFLFGGIAELLDNARDASATKINIYSVADENVRGGYLLCFLDDGEGMQADEAYDIITFGKSTKKSQDSHMIGMYGNGLKSGSMRIGNDFILFTKKGPTMSCVFLSRSFHEEEKIDEIVVPMPSFESQTKKSTAKTPKEREKHNIEMDLILKYSPFKTEAQFMKEFDKIEGSSGTLMVIYNMKLLDSGEPELDVKTDEYDILLTHPDGNEFDSEDGKDPRLTPEKKSFRAYASVLYVDPRMRIYIQGKKVRTKRLANCLYKPRIYKYSSNRFKTRAENEAVKAKEESKVAENRAREAESKAKNLENKYGNGGNKDQRAELRKAQANAVDLRKEAQIKKQMADRKLKSLRDPKTLNFIFGININNRNQDGMFVYNCSRLIKMYQKVGPQADGGVFCSGVVGVVDVPYLVLEPTHNKQDFADAKEYRHLQRAMGEHMVQYWKDIGIAQQGVTKFWETFGYISANWRDSPSVDPKFIRKRAMQVQITLQCDLCLKWRMLPFSANNIGKMFPDDWVCSMNPDPAHNRCSAPEQKMNIPEGLLKKETKTRDQKEKDLEDEIKKKQEQLEKMQKVKPITSSKHVRELEDTKQEKETVAQRRSSTSSNSTSRSTAKVKVNESPIKKRPASRVIVQEESSSSEEEEEEEEEEEIPPKRRRSQPPPPPPKPKPKPKPVIRSAARSSAARSSAAKKPLVRVRPPRRQETSSEDEDVEDVQEVTQEPKSIQKEAPPKRGRARTEKSDSEVAPSPRQTESASAESDHDDAGPADDAMDTTEPDDGSPVQDSSDIGRKVEVKVQGKWIKATVVEVNQKQEKWKLKLEKHPQGRHDKWYAKDSADIRTLSLALLQATAELQDAESTTTAVVSDSGTSQVQEAPSSSTVASSSATAGITQMTEDIANGYRTCLRYFLPPQWVMDKESVSTLTIQELAGFPLDDFFDHYEKGLRKLVSSFQFEAQSKQLECEQTKAKLFSVRKLIAKLLKSINEEFDIDPECDTDQVDELLAMCVKQATQGTDGAC